jgi:hypothetical protein
VLIVEAGEAPSLPETLSGSPVGGFKIHVNLVLEVFRHLIDTEISVPPYCPQLDL